MEGKIFMHPELVAPKHAFFMPAWTSFVYTLSVNMQLVSM